LGIVYLGPNLPPEDIISAAKRSSAQVVVLGILAANEQVGNAVRQVLRGLQGRMELWLAGSHAAEMTRGIRSRRLVVVSDFEGFEAHLQRLGAKL
jgi:methylmalonyl-CoA mutase cobalamin-binding subunit